ncbi:MAG: hypothetical protein MUF62_02190 [Chitinophagaceae bacterium]|nr:hypothetical protein [Chitinophagaceae bacterium]
MLLVLNACNKSNNTAEELVLRKTYSPSDKNPFGGYLAHALIDSTWQNTGTSKNRLAFNKWYDKRAEEDGLGSNEVYVIMAEAVEAYDAEASALRRYMERGNTVLIITDRISEILSETLNLQLKDNLPSLPFLQRLGMSNTGMQLTDSLLPAELRRSYQYFFRPMANSIKLTRPADSSVVVGLGINESETVWRLQIGAGQLVVAANAAVASNYFLAQAKNYQLLQALMSYFPPDPAQVTVDAFYYKYPYRQPEDYSVFQALLAIPPLRWAFWLLIALGIIWVLSNLRRQQKMIPILAPNVNSTVSFIETIAQLYFNKQDHGNIARKITAHFTDQLRRNYYMQPLTDAREWPVMLSRKTGMELADAQRAAELMQKAHAGETFSATELLELHSLVAKVSPDKQHQARL